MTADFALARNDRFRQARSFFRRFDAVFIRFRIDEFERVGRGYFLVELFILAVIKKSFETLARAEPKMIAAMLADLLRFFQLAFIERGVAFQTFDEDAFGFDLAFFIGGLTLRVSVFFD